MKISLHFFTCAFISACLFFFSGSAAAQVNDAGLWFSTGIEKKLNSRFSVSFNPTLRFNENISELGSAFIDAGTEYKINKRIRVSANYRLSSRKKLDDSYGIRHRFYADFSYRKKLKQITLTYRFRVLTQYTEMLSSEKGNIPQHAIRNKIQLKYETVTRYAPFLSGEIWYGINYRQNQFDRYRLTGGFEFEINKYSSMVLSYIFQREINSENPVTDYITSVGYNYSF